MPTPEIKILIAAVAGRIRSLRLSRSLTQEALAEKAGLPVETISRAENARMMPTLATLAAVATALGVDLADLVDPSRALPPPALSPEEEAILALLRAATPRARELVAGLLEELRGRK